MVVAETIRTLRTSDSTAFSLELSLQASPQNEPQINCMQHFDFFPPTFVLPADKDKLIEFAAAFAAAAPPTKGKAASTASSAAAAKPGESKDASLTAGNKSVFAPPPGCWPKQGQQPQPQAAAGDRLVYIVKPDGGSRGQGIYLALALEDIDALSQPTSEEESAPSHPRRVGAGPWRQPPPDDEDDTDENDAGAAGGAGKAGQPAPRPVLVQAYLPRPLLMDGRKFDLRIYVLVTSSYPTLRLYVYQQGLVRFATEDYQSPDESNIAQRRMFLTNYAVNKPGERPRSPKTGVDDVPESQRAAAPPALAGGADDFSDQSDDEAESCEEDGVLPGTAAGAGRKPRRGKPDPLPTKDRALELLRARQGCKWTLSALFECLARQGIDTATLWERIKDVITKTILAIRPVMAQRYRAARPGIRKEEAPKAPPQKRKIVRPVFASANVAAAATAPLTPNGSAGGDASADDTGGRSGSEADSAPIGVPHAARGDSADMLDRALREGDSAGAGRRRALSDTSVMAGAEAALPSGLQPTLAGSVSAYSSATSLVGAAPYFAAATGGIGGAARFPGGAGVAQQWPYVMSGRPAPLQQQQQQHSGVGGGTAVMANSTGAVAAFGRGNTLSNVPPLHSKKVPLGKNAAAPAPATDSFGFGVSGMGLGIVGSTVSFATQRPAPAVKAGILAARHQPQQLPQLEVAGALATSAAAPSRLARAGATLLGLPPASSSLRATSSFHGGGSTVASASGEASDAASTLGGADSVASSTTAATGTTRAGTDSHSKPGAGGRPRSNPSESRGSGGPDTSATGTLSEAASSGARKLGASGQVADAGTVSIEEEDGEQGFRCYELMGLDIILDMSHCTCGNNKHHQKLFSDPGRASAHLGTCGGKRCQPRPVLLEINQSCSLHTDSDLDKVVKGDAVTDAFGMSAPDERWLLEHFLATLRQDLVAASSDDAAANREGSAALPSPRDALAPKTEAGDPQLAASDTRQPQPWKAGTFADDRWSLTDLPRALATALNSRRAAEAEAAALFQLYKQYPVPQHVRAHLLGKTDSGARSEPDASVTSAPSPAPVPASGAGASWPTAPGAPPQQPLPLRLETIPWVPAPPRAALLSAFAAAWQEELWFGGGLALQKPAAPGKRGGAGATGLGGGIGVGNTGVPGGGTAGSAATPAGGSLATIPLLSTRALIVLLLRRMYERVHTGGFERLLPPPTPELAERYRAVAEYVPANLRET